ncbi:hypothetical protein HAX54_022432 [Datura stramonium]|uniref:Uncharacterized protein n=1 Tax=Datura stramonium TaxID=4076 RepID=A0ABS8UWB6_DATST|nr:hypothetical protein [Datura stramonium]
MDLLVLLGKIVEKLLLLQIHLRTVCILSMFELDRSQSGTDSKISATLGDVSGKSVWIPDLEKWGLMGPDYNYYERGNVDIFTGKGRCLNTNLPA